MSETPTEFYDQFADDYHLIYPNWDQVVRNQGSALKIFIQTQISDSTGLSILDCSSGTGTQAIGLALEGYTVTGADISPKEIETAKQVAKRLGVSLSFKVADFTKLSETIKEQFDVVLSYDNAIGHVKDESALKGTFSSIKKCIKPGGTLLISVRDYDKLRLENPCGTLPRTVEDQFGKRIITQTWEWNEAGDAYELTLFILQKKGSDWSAQAHGPVRMRAFNRSEIEEALRKNDAAEIRWFEPKESGYYQPVVMAKFK